MIIGRRGAASADDGAAEIHRSILYESGSSRNQKVACNDGATVESHVRARHLLHIAIDGPTVDLRRAVDPSGADVLRGRGVNQRRGEKNGNNCAKRRESLHWGDGG